MSLFKFKTKKIMIGEFDPDDEDEWTLLIKPQIQDMPLFMHFHKGWNVTEVAEDEENDIEGISKMPTLGVYTGFIKDGKFVVTNNRTFGFDSFIDIKKDYVLRLEKFTNEGFTKDWNMYSNDKCIVPDYHKNSELESTNSRILNIVKASTANTSNKSKLTTKKLLKHIMIGNNTAGLNTNP